MEAIRDTIKNLMQAWDAKLGQPPKDNPEVILKKVLAKKEREHVKLNYFKKGILGVSVDSSTWLYYMSLQKEDLLAKLGKKSSAIKDIRFSLGEINPHL